MAGWCNRPRRADCCLDTTVQTVFVQAACTPHSAMTKAFTASAYWPGRHQTACKIAPVSSPCAPCDALAQPDTKLEAQEDGAEPQWAHLPVIEQVLQCIAAGDSAGRSKVSGASQVHSRPALAACMCIQQPSRAVLLSWNTYVRSSCSRHRSYLHPALCMAHQDPLLLGLLLLPTALHRLFPDRAD